MPLNSNDNESVTPLESPLSEPEILMYSLPSNPNSSQCSCSLKKLTKINQAVSAYELMYGCCCRKEKDPLDDGDLKKEQTLIECSNIKKSEDSLEDVHMKIINDNDSDEDLQNRQIIIESSEKSESTEIQKKIVQEFHDYSISPARHGRVAVKQTVNLIKKKLKAAQQKHRRLERRVGRLKGILEKLKQKNV